MTEPNETTRRDETKEALVGSGGEQRADVFPLAPVQPVPIEMITSAPGPLMSAPPEPAGGGSSPDAPGAQAPQASLED